MSPATHPARCWAASSRARLSRGCVCPAHGLLPPRTRPENRTCTHFPHSMCIRQRFHSSWYESQEHSLCKVKSELVSLYQLSEALQHGRHLGRISGHPGAEIEALCLYMNPSLVSVLHLIANPNIRRLAASSQNTCRPPNTQLCHGQAGVIPDKQP